MKSRLHQISFKHLSLSKDESNVPKYCLNNKLLKENVPFKDTSFSFLNPTDSPDQNSNHVYIKYIEALRSRQESQNFQRPCNKSIDQLLRNQDSIKLESHQSIQENAFDEPVHENKNVSGTLRVPLKEIQRFYLPPSITEPQQKSIISTKESKHSLKEEIHLILQNQKQHKTKISPKSKLNTPKSTQYRVNDFTISLYLRNQTKQNNQENISNNISNHCRQTSISQRSVEWLKRIKEKQEKQKVICQARTIEGCTFKPVTNKNKNKQFFPKENQRRIQRNLYID